MALDSTNVIIETTDRQRTAGAINAVAIGTDSIIVSESVRSLGD